jgi:hypothetical protein
MFASRMGSCIFQTTGTAACFTTITTFFKGISTSLANGMGKKRRPVGVAFL